MLHKLILLALILACTAFGSPVFSASTPYLSFADSPFALQSFSYFYLENFESGSVLTPGVTLSGASFVLGPASLTDSVDGDDGSPDGSGTRGHSLYIGRSNVVRFSFDAPALGGLLPTHAGIVWTDAGFADPVPGFGNVIFRAYGPANNLLGAIGPFVLGDGQFTGQTAEDRFFGVMDPGGISAIEISTVNSTDWEVDHLQFGSAAAKQFGSAVPEPGTYIMLTSGLTALLLGRLKRRAKG